MKEIAIIGGGIGGLTLAICLKNTNKLVGVTSWLISHLCAIRNRTGAYIKPAPLLAKK